MDIPGHYETVEDLIAVGDWSARITRIASIDRLYDNLVAQGDDHHDVRDERIPYWADLWHSAIGLSRWLTRRPELVRGRSVIEIGCGLGLPGIVAARLGGRVTMTDYIDEACRFARYNAVQNGISGISFRKMDWRRPNVSLAADVVLASDVAYESRSFGILLSAFSALVKPGGTVLVSEPGRDFAGPFFEELKGMFELKAFTEPVLYNEMTVPVRIYRMGIVRE